MDINLTSEGNDIVSKQRGARVRSERSDRQIIISQLRLHPSAATQGMIDVFGCLCRPTARWPIEIADTLKWPVRTVYPGFGIYFPRSSSQPKSAIPCTRLFRPRQWYDDGWALWIPGLDRPIRIFEPTHHSPPDNVRIPARRCQLKWWEFALICIIRLLEPLRDIRSHFRNRFTEYRHLVIVQRCKARPR